MGKCDLEFGRVVECLDNVGGIAAVYLVPFDELPFNDIFINEDELINIGGLTPNAFKYEVLNSTNSFNESNNIDEGTGNISWSGTLTLKFPKQSNLSQAELKKLPSTRSKVIVEYKAGYFRFMGVENGCDFKVSTSSGSNLADFNGYDLEITSEEGIMSPFIYLGLDNLGFEVVTDIPTPSDSASFITNWRTTTSSEVVTLPYNVAGTYSGTIDWGDGNVSANTYSNRAHTYSSAGDYTISIDGTILLFSFNDSGDRIKLIEIVQWGTGIDLSTSTGSFYGCDNLSANLTADVLINVPTNMTDMFRNCTSLSNIRFINSWNMSAVTNLQETFGGCSIFNTSLNSWDVSNVVTMFNLFKGCTSFNQPLNSWNVSTCNILGGMFENATSFNGDISSWDVSDVNNFISTFAGATSFNGDISSWVLNALNNVTASDMFNGATSFNKNINGWNTNKITFMSRMFKDATAFDQPLSSWTFTGLLNSTGLDDFMEGKDVVNYSCDNYSTLLGTWATQVGSIPVQGNVDMGTLKYLSASQGDRDTLTGATWTITDAGLCDISDNLTLEYTIASPNTIIELPYVSFGTYSGTIDWGDTTSSTNTYANRFHTFVTPGTYDIIVDGGVSGFNYFGRTGASLVTDIKRWGPNVSFFNGAAGKFFTGCFNLDISATDVPNDVWTMDEMFANLPNLVNASGSIGLWDVSAVVTFSDCFNSCNQFNQDLSAWDTSAAVSMDQMFAGAAVFNQPLSGFTTTNVTNMSGMFANCPAFDQDISNWDTSNVITMRLMFSNATAFDQSLSAWTFTSIQDLSSFMQSKTNLNYSTTNYDGLIDAWEQGGQSNMNGIDMGTIKRTAASTTDYNTITITRNWSITDGGI
tara:strand:- start:13628 stop:16225 length:2598 start_codon:yes stop_codon:yes gene_type:complete